VSALAAAVDTGPEVKPSEIGLIPCDWKLVKVGDVCRLVNGRGFKPYEWRTRGLPIIRIQNLNGSTDFNFFDGHYDRKIEIETGQLLFAWSGSRGTSFGPHIWHGPLGVLNYHTWKVVVDEAAVSRNFFFHALKGLTEFIEGQAHGASALVHVQKWQMEGFQLAIPESTSEQEAIAEALSDADALIKSLEALIAKKRAIKQGAMQDLLSGGKRLPAVSGDWVDGAILEIADCLDNLRVPLNGTQRADMIGSYPYCGANGVLDFVDGYCLEDDVILMAEDGGYFDEYESRPIAYRMSGKIWVNNHAHILKAKPHFDNDFLFFSLVHKNILPFLASGTRAKLNKSEMNKITIRHPQNKDEQKSIAEVLNSIELELDALASRLDKARQIKHGMMQELLTGRVRLA
jgi:type I restriction enzyme S subunit